MLDDAARAELAARVIAALQAKPEIARPAVADRRAATRTTRR